MQDGHSEAKYLTLRQFGIFRIQVFVLSVKFTIADCRLHLRCALWSPVIAFKNVVLVLLFNMNNLTILGLYQGLSFFQKISLLVVLFLAKEMSKLPLSYSNILLLIDLNSIRGKNRLFKSIQNQDISCTNPIC